MDMDVQKAAAACGGDFREEHVWNQENGFESNSPLVAVRIKSFGTHARFFVGD